GKVRYVAAATIGWVDGDTVVFDTLFNATPVIDVKISSAPDPRQLFWSAGFDPGRPIYVELAALNPSASGFQIRARYYQKPVTYGVGAANFSGTFDALHETAEATLTAVPAFGHRYEFSASGTISAGGDVDDEQTTTATLALEVTYDGTNWIELDSRVISRTADNNVAAPWTFSATLVPNMVQVVPGLAPGNKFRWRVKTLTLGSSGAGTGTFSGTGTDVDYVTELEGTPSLTSDAYGAGVLDAEGEHLSVELASAPAYDDKYLVTYAVSMFAQADQVGIDPIFIILPGSVHMEVAIDSSSDGGSIFVERAVHSYSLSTEDFTSGASHNFSVTKTITVSGLRASAPADEIRVRLKGLSIDSPGGVGVGSIDPTNVKYALLGTVASFASMTPNQDKDEDDRVRWTAQSGA
ncbi:MAG: hypothetical protein ACREMA_01305, partial [Longimicrobiales bacterium]